jgi:hypothetical protein
MPDGTVVPSEGISDAREHFKIVFQFLSCSVIIAEYVIISALWRALQYLFCASEYYKFSFFSDVALI